MQAFPASATSKGKVVESSARHSPDSAMIRHHRSLSLSVSDDRSIITITMAGLDQIVAAFLML